jgi:hypothetical protein
MSTDATEADQRRVLVGLQSLWQRPAAAGRLPGTAASGGWGDRAATQAAQDAVVLEIWEDEGGAAVRRSSEAHGRAAANRRGLPVRQGFRSDAPPESPAPARPLKT